MQELVPGSTLTEYRHEAAISHRFGISFSSYFLLLIELVLSSKADFPPDVMWEATLLILSRSVIAIFKRRSGKFYLIITCVYKLFSVSFAYGLFDIGENEKQVLKYIDDDGKAHILDLTPKFNNSTSRSRGIPSNQYLLYTRNNPTNGQYLENRDLNSITSSSFNPAVATVVIVHGFKGNKKAEVNTVIRDALLEESNVNVIVVDWGLTASLDYFTAANSVSTIGRNLGSFIEFLVTTTGASLDNFHLVGHSLGAHVVGNAGRTLGGKVARITGLDPAGPLFDKSSARLKSTDAKYVEAIHTNALGLGIGVNLGDTDFFPNGGVLQPGCLTLTCSHSRSWQLFAATVKHSYLIGSKCENTLPLFDLCRGSTLPMGNNNLQKSGTGVYRLKTSSAYPYYQHN